MNENQQRDQIVLLAKSMFERGLTFGSSGNISARVDDGWLMTPTGSTMGTLDPAKISRTRTSPTRTCPDRKPPQTFRNASRRCNNARFGSFERGDKLF